jgi:hypothetical protein
MNNNTTPQTMQKENKRKDFEKGYALYVQDKSVRECRNEAQRQGWLQALDSQAVADLPRDVANRLGW